MVLSQYGRDLISKKPKQKSPTIIKNKDMKNSFTTKKQTMVSKRRSCRDDRFCYQSTQ